MTRFFSLLLFVTFLIQPYLAWAQAVPSDQTSATNAIIVDYETGAVLLEKNADEKMPTSSMSKVMSMYLVFDALKKGQISLEDTFTVSEDAWRMGGSKMFVEVGKAVAVEDLIRGVIVQSGNDASKVLAEGLAGSESAFADGLNIKARELGMENSHFTNASGWPDPDHYSTARDLSILARHLVSDFPEYYKYYSEKEFTYNNIAQQNRNPLLYRDIGADGIKTGHTEIAGYGLMGSGVQNGRRVIMVVNGLESNEARAQESGRLMEWALRSFENRKILSAGETIEHVAVVKGKESTVPAVVQEDVTITYPRMAASEITASARFMEPLPAPVKQGQEIGTLEISVPQIGVETYKLYAAADVAPLGFVARTVEKARLFFAGKM